MSMGGIEEKISLTKVTAIVTQNNHKTQPQIHPKGSFSQIAKIRGRNRTRQYYWLSHTEQEEESQTEPNSATVLSAHVRVEFNIKRKSNGSQRLMDLDSWA